jgi:hypothetical protein
MEARIRNLRKHLWQAQIDLDAIRVEVAHTMPDPSAGSYLFRGQDCLDQARMYLGEALTALGYGPPEQFLDREEKQDERSGEEGHGGTPADGDIL